jgi:hypothetical protein
LSSSQHREQVSRHLLPALACFNLRKCLVCAAEPVADATFTKAFYKRYQEASALPSGERRATTLEMMNTQFHDMNMHPEAYLPWEQTHPKETSLRFAQEKKMYFWNT